MCKLIKYIKYSPNCIKQDKVKQVKRLLIKLYKKVDESDYYFRQPYIKLTGRYKDDFYTVNFYLEYEYNSIKEAITEEVELKEYDFQTKLIYLNFLIELEKIIHIIASYEDRYE